MQHFLKGMSTAFFFALILSLSSLPLLAQMQFTGVRGNVEDETGARVTQVEITATEEATALKRTTISNELGIYELRWPAAWDLHRFGGTGRFQGL